MRDDERCALLDAPREPLLHRRLRDLHVSRLDDRAIPQARSDFFGDFVEERVGFGATAAMVDEEKRSHAEDLGSASTGVNLRRTRRVLGRRSQRRILRTN